MEVSGNSFAFGEMKEGDCVGSSIKRNFVYQMAYEALVLILPLITSPYESRIVGAEGLGKYSYSYSVAYYFVLFSMLGLKNYGNRAIAQVRDDRGKCNQTFSDILFVHIIVSVFSCVLYALYVMIIKEDKVYAAIQGMLVLSALFDISWFYFGMERFKITTVQSSIVRIITIVFIFIFVKTVDDLWKYCAIMSFGTLFGQIILWLPLPKYVRMVKPSLQGMRLHIKPLIVLFLPAIAVSLYKYMDRIMIGAIKGNEQLGYYDNAEKIVNTVLSVIVAFGSVMLPRMSNMLQSKDRHMAARYINVSIKYVMFLAFGMTFGLFATGKMFAVVFWGEEFSYSGILIVGLTAIIPFFSFASVIRTLYLIPAERDKEYLISIIAGAAINLIVNWMLIPPLGSLGAAMGTIAAETLVCCVQTVYVRKELEIRRYLRNSLPFLIFGTVMFMPVYILGRTSTVSIETLAIQVLTGVIIYLSESVLYFYYTKDEVFMNVLYRFLQKN